MEKPTPDPRSATVSLLSFFFFLLHFSLLSPHFLPLFFLRKIKKDRPPPVLSSSSSSEASGEKSLRGLRRFSCSSFSKRTHLFFGEVGTGHRRCSWPEWRKHKSATSGQKSHCRRNGRVVDRLTEATLRSCALSKVGARRRGRATRALAPTSSASIGSDRPVRPPVAVARRWAGSFVGRPTRSTCSSSTNKARRTAHAHHAPKTPTCEPALATGGRTFAAAGHASLDAGQAEAEPRFEFPSAIGARSAMTSSSANETARLHPQGAGLESPPPAF